MLMVGNLAGERISPVPAGGVTWHRHSGVLATVLGYPSGVACATGRWSEGKGSWHHDPGDRKGTTGSPSAGGGAGVGIGCGGVVATVLGCSGGAWLR